MTTTNDTTDCPTCHGTGSTTASFGEQKCCDHWEAVDAMQRAEIERLRAEVAKWKNRCEGSEESLRLAMDEGLRAW